MLEELSGGRNAQLGEEPAQAYIRERIALTPPVADPIDQPGHRKRHRRELIALAPPTKEADENTRPGDDHPLAGKRHQVADEVQHASVEGAHEAGDRHVQLVQLDADRGEDGQGGQPEDHPLPGFHGAQSARKMLNPPFSFTPRSDTHTSFEPSGENMGKLLKPPSEVTCSRPVPSSLMRNKWNERRWRAWTLDEKMIRRPSGWQNGATFAAPGRHVDVVIVQGPEVPALDRRLGRALRTLGVRGREKHAPVPG